MSGPASVAVDKKRTHRASQGDATFTFRHLEDADGPANRILPQPGLHGAGRRRWWEHRDPQSEDAAVSLSAVQSRLWLGGMISRHRDLPLITRLVQRVRACAATPAILVCVDGLASYVTAFLKVFRQPVYTGRRGRPRLVLPDGLQFAQVIKH